MPSTNWPLDRRQTARLLHSLIHAHLGESMDFTTFLDERGYPLEDITLGADGYPLDSLSLMSLASQTARVFHLTDLGLEDLLLRRRSLKGWVDLLLESWCVELDRITFFSSGSTGKPKPVTHTRESLLQETAYLSGLFPETKRIVAVVPAHHIYGFLFTVLLPRHIGVPVLEGRAMGSRALFNQLEDGDLVVSHPFQWRYLAQLWPQLDRSITGVTSTAPCPAETAALLKERGLQRLVEVYGSSETGGLGARDQHGSPYTLFDYWRKADDTDDPELIRRLPDAQEVRIQSPDLLAWDRARGFKVRGRRDGAVQVGGHNVFPSAIARILLEHPEVDNCVVRLMQPQEGERLKAFIVPDLDAEPEGLAARLHAWCGKELRSAERPAHFTIGDSLPRTSMGKSADWTLN